MTILETLIKLRDDLKLWVTNNLKTKADETYVDTEISSLKALVGNKAVSEQIYDAVTEEARIARTAEQTNANAISTIEEDYLKSSDKAELDEKITTNSNAIELLTNGVSAEEVDSVNDLIEYVNEHGAEVIAINDNIKANTDAIDALEKKVESDIIASVADWDQVDSTATNYIKNKIPVKNGTGVNSIVIADGKASGKYSVAGGTADKSLITDITGGLASLLVSAEAPEASANMSMAFGTNTVAQTPGAMALGIGATAGIKGYYFSAIDFENKKITLSTKQSTTQTKPSGNISWSKGGFLSSADVICIRNKDMYYNCSTITAVDNTNKTITVDSLPFSSVVALESDSSPDEHAVFVISKPTAGEVSFGMASFSRGYNTVSAGLLAHAEGRETMALGTTSHAEGRETVASHIAHAEGYKSQALADNTHAEGYNTTASGTSSHSEGTSTVASGAGSHAEGSSTVASGNSAHSEGYKTEATGAFSHAEGRNGTIDDGATYRPTIASAEASHAQGAGSQATAYAAHAEGHYTTASSNSAHAEGSRAVASGAQSHAEGLRTTASGAHAHAEGADTKAEAPNSHAEGYNTKTTKNNAHAEGEGTIAASTNQHVEGRYNIEDSTGKYLHITGIGTSDTDRKNGFTVSKNGEGWFAGDVTVGADGKKLATEEYVNNMSISGGGNVQGDWNENDYSSPAYIKNRTHWIEGSKSEEIFNETIIAEPEYATYSLKNNMSWRDFKNVFVVVNDVEYLCDVVTNYGNYTEEEIAQGYFSYEVTVDSLFKIYAADFDSGYVNIRTYDQSIYPMNLKIYSLGNEIYHPLDKNFLPEDVVYQEDLKNIELDKYATTEYVDNKAKQHYVIAGQVADVKVGSRATAEGYNTTASASQAHAEGYLTVASNYHAHAEGHTTQATGEQAHAEGRETIASGSRCHAEGYLSKAEGDSSHAEGYGTYASGSQVHAEGWSTEAYGFATHAEGINTRASAEGAHAEGKNTIAVGFHSHAEGAETCTEYTAPNSHAEGYQSRTYGNNAHAEGEATIAKGTNSHAEGNNTIAISQMQHVQGKWNILDVKKDSDGNMLDSDGNITTDIAYAAGGNKYAHIVGNGTDENNRSNAHTLDWSGNAWFAGAIKIGGNTYNEGKTIATEEYVNNHASNSDWNENDSSSPSYVNNRTHWKESERKVKLSVAISDFIQASNRYKYYLDDQDFLFEFYIDSGDIFTVNGKECSATFDSGSWEHEDGNYGYWSNATLDVGNTVIEWRSDNGYCSLTINTDAPSDIVISELAGEVYHKLDKNYLPEDVVYTETYTGTGENSIVIGDTAKAITANSIAVGNGSIAGCKGFYWHSFDFTNNKIQLSRSLPDVELSWNSNGEEKALLDEWKDTIGGLLNIARVKVHTPLSLTLVGVDSDNGIITVDKIPFTEDAMNQDLAKYPNQLEFEDCYVINPYKPSCGVVELGIESFAMGSGSIAAGTMSQAVGRDTIAAGNYGHAEGRGTIASYSAHAEGRDTRAIGLSSHAEGNETTAYGQKSHSEGARTQALGYAAHAEGENTVAENNNSHAEGYQSKASGEMSHAEGSTTIASGLSAHAEGNSTLAAELAAHAEGYQTQALGRHSHTEGYKTLANKYQAHAEGNSTYAIAERTHAEGLGTIAATNDQHVQGKYNIADVKRDSSGNMLDKDGNITTDILEAAPGNKYAHIIGNGSSDTSRKNAHTVDWQGNAWFSGDVTVGSENKKLATEEYVNNKAKTHYVTAGQLAGSTLGSKATAEGHNTVASGNYSHAEGYGTKATGNHSHTEGYNTEAHAYQAHAEGNTTIAKSQYSHSEGFRTIANGESQHVQGQYNIEDTIISNNKGKYLHIVGNGTADNKRSNAHTLDWQGNAWFAGDVTVGADNKKLATEDYINNLIGNLEATINTLTAALRENGINI